MSQAPSTHPLPFDYEALIQTLNQLTKDHPCAEFSYIGNSVLGRSIPLIRLGSGRHSVLYVGAHHGMEWITAAILCRFLKDFCIAAESNVRIGKYYPADFLETRTVYILPMLNPDGVEYQIHGITSENPLYERLLEMNGGSQDFSHWQANARGVDLNHNYDAGFDEYKKMENEMGILQGAPTRYSGESPESEPESERLASFIRFHEELRGVLTLHTQGEEIFTQCIGSRAREISLVSKRLADLSGYRISSADGPAAYGGLTDWCIQKRNLPAFTVECGSGVNPLPGTDLSSIYLRLREMLFSFPALV